MKNFCIILGIILSALFAECTWANSASQPGIQKESIGNKQANAFPVFARFQGVWFEKNYYDALMKTKSLNKAYKIDFKSYPCLVFFKSGNNYFRGFTDFHDGATDTVFSFELVQGQDVTGYIKASQDYGKDLNTFHGENIFTWEYILYEDTVKGDYVKACSCGINDEYADGIWRAVSELVLKGNYTDEKGNKYIIDEKLNFNFKGEKYTFEPELCYFDFDEFEYIKHDYDILHLKDSRGREKTLYYKFAGNNMELYKMDDGWTMELSSSKIPKKPFLVLKRQ